MIVDTHAWLGYFNGDKGYSVLDGLPLKTPTIVLAELQRKMIQKKVSEKDQQRFFALIRKRSLLVPLDEEHAYSGGKLAESERLPFADALIYSYTSEDEHLLTGDPHFKGKKFVRFNELSEK